MKFNTLSVVLGLLFIISCSDNDGSIGPVGPEGPPGDNLIGQGYEVPGNLTEANDYFILSNFFEDSNIQEVFDTDIVLVYRLDVANTETDDDVWQPLPLIQYTSDGGQFQYRFDHTLNDVIIELDGNIDLSRLDPIYTIDQIFRVVILPAEYVAENNIDVANTAQVMGAVGEQNFKRVQYLKK